MNRSWSNLIKPNKLEVDEKSLTSTYGKFYGEPFERGFGQTIGSAVRRVLLSSLMGSAITSIRVKGVLHEFSTIPGVTEDVTDIILNLKQVRLKLFNVEQGNLKLEAKGPKVVLAKDIKTGPNMEIISPEQHIAALSKEGKLEIEMVAKMGRGYVPAERNKDEEAPVDTIYLDAVFTPIKKVNFNITNARVGQRTDYERLVLEVWTDGSVKPDDAVAYAAKILEDHLGIFINFEEEPQDSETRKDTTTTPLNENLFRSVDELEFSVRSQNCLQSADIKFIGELVQKSEPEMLKTKNFGRKSLNEIKEILREMGLELGMKLDYSLTREDLDNRKQAKQKETA
ncbi:MAG: DNA-directed RNA polymerase subunit alpha [Candidatus Binatia bacterium]